MSNSVWDMSISVWDMSKPSLAKWFGFKSSAGIVHSILLRYVYEAVIGNPRAKDGLGYVRERSVFIL